jgi:hypothetical protein
MKLLLFILLVGMVGCRSKPKKMVKSDMVFGVSTTLSGTSGVMSISSNPPVWIGHSGPSTPIGRKHKRIRPTMREGEEIGYGILTSSCLKDTNAIGWRINSDTVIHFDSIGPIYKTVWRCDTIWMHLKRKQDTTPITQYLKIQ